jgi:hypothetical protein
MNNVRYRLNDLHPGQEYGRRFEPNTEFRVTWDRYYRALREDVDARLDN